MLKVYTPHLLGIIHTLKDLTPQLQVGDLMQKDHNLYPQETFPMLKEEKQHHQGIVPMLKDLTPQLQVGDLMLKEKVLQRELAQVLVTQPMLKVIILQLQDGIHMLKEIKHQPKIQVPIQVVNILHLLQITKQQQDNLIQPATQVYQLVKMIHLLLEEVIVILIEEIDLKYERIMVK